MLPTGFNLSAEIDITETYQKIKEAGMKFFPAYLYLAEK
jgi:Chloramphenicol acetyltransferase.